MVATFDSHGSIDFGPLVVSVPHAGQDYPQGIEADLNVPLRCARALEDRHADMLAGDLVARGATVLIARTPRLLIDLNRSETDIDPAHIAGRATRGAPLSIKARGGLGLVPWQLSGIGKLWRAPIAPGVLAQRISGTHRPYHHALDEALNAAKQRYGGALLIDLHSMPRLAGANPAAIVIGDRNGHSAGPMLAAAACAWIARRAVRVAHNAPYAGGHIVERHGNPIGGVNALQIEVDRSLYLDAALDSPGPGLPAMARLIAALAEHLMNRSAGVSLPIAAE